MRQLDRLFIFAIAVAVGLGVVAAAPGPASAEDEAQKDGDGEGEEPRQKEVRMPFLTGAVQAGMLFFSANDFEKKDSAGDLQHLMMSERLGVVVKLHLNLLGDGLGLEITPFFASEHTGDAAIGRFATVGLDLGLAYRFHIRRFYPKIGIGGRIAYLGGGDIDLGMEAFGRLPIGFSVYFLRFLAFDMEVSLLTGTTGIQAKSGLFGSLVSFDYTTGLEVVIGLRFP